MLSRLYSAKLRKDQVQDLLAYRHCKDVFKECMKPSKGQGKMAALPKVMACRGVV